MIFENPQDLMGALRPMAPLVGLDLGTKTIGVALSDRLWTVATAALVIKRSKFTDDATLLIAFSEKNDVGALVLGLPRNMDGSEGPRAQSTRSFAKNLARSWSACPPILFWDERLSTVEAERTMIEADISRKKRGEKIDAVAASLILQGALDRIAVLRHG